MWTSRCRGPQQSASSAHQHVVGAEQHLAGLRDRRYPQGKRPWMLTARTDLLALLIDRGAQMPSLVPQSSSRMMTSWETSTRRRVR